MPRRAARPRTPVEALESRRLLAGDFVSAFQFAPVTGFSPKSQPPALAVDPNGNLAIAGTFATTTIDLDPGAGTTNLTTTAVVGDTYVARYSAAGALLWARLITAGSGFSNGFNNAVITTDVATDADGSVYLTGHFSGPVDFDPGPGDHTLTAARQDVFVLKLDNAGAFQWVQPITTARADGTMAGGSLVVDAGRNVFYTAVADMDHFGVYNGNVLVGKLDPTGTPVWSRRTRHLGAEDSSTLTADPKSIPDLVTDSAGDVIVSGTFYQRALFGAGEAGATRLVGGNVAGFVFVWKLDPTGDTLWAISQGDGSDTQGAGIAVDASDNLYTTGNFRFQADFDPSRRGQTVLSDGGTSISAYVTKISPAGALVWARMLGRRVGGYGFSYSDAVAIAPDGSVYTAGRFGEKVDLDPDPATAFVINGTTTDGGAGVNFLTRLDAAGNFVYAHSFGGLPVLPLLTDTKVLSLALSPGTNRLYVSDIFHVTADFDPDPLASHNLTSVSLRDAYVLELTL
jgi:hypothetical protein